MIFILKNNFFLIFIFLIFFCVLSIDFFLNESYIFVLEFYFSNRLRFTFPILLDFYRILFGLVVLFIRRNIIKFCTFYIEEETYKTRFLLTLLLFILSMLFLIFIPNLVFLMIGWDGLGISSFFLIMFYQNQKSLGARMITLLSNRIGDLCLLLSIAIFFSLGTVFSYYTILLRGLLIIGCFTKRAQFPFIRWLPAAMAAPTPVSALVHSSTLVTAGVYLLIRFSSIILRREYISLAVATISRLTIFISALAAMFETDFKKIIALSTLRQLGFIIFRLSQIIKLCRFFHLITHAIFKSLLFICAGAVIVFGGHNQDIRGLSKFINSIIQSSFIIARIALIRVPFIVGFYSKDLILEIIFQNQTTNWFLALLVFFRSWLTVAYSLRIMFLRRWQSPNFKFFPFSRFNEISWIYKAVCSSRLASIIAGAILSALLCLGPKFFLPGVSQGEIGFICLFIVGGICIFIIFSSLKPIYSIFHLFYLTPVLQKLPESSFHFSKKLTHYSDLAWLEKVSYGEVSYRPIEFSSVLYLLIKNKTLIIQFLAFITLFILIIWL